jgi:enoyl-CoA hydratase/carnithine racemase
MIRAMRSGVVYLAAINGPCLGGGLELALACGLRHVGDGEHIRLGSPEVLGGILPGAGDTQHRPRIVGNGRALELILEGRSLDPRAALELGRVHRMTPPVDLLAEAQATTARLATRSKVAVAVAKRAVYASSQLPICAGLLVEAVFTRERERLGDTPFLADPEPWAPGTR